MTVEGAKAILKNAAKAALKDFNACNDSSLDILEELTQYQFPFEDAVFEGGGVAYVGAVKVSWFTCVYGRHSYFSIVIMA